MGSTGENAEKKKRKLAEEGTQLKERLNKETF